MEDELAKRDFHPKYDAKIVIATEGLMESSVTWWVNCLYDSGLETDIDLYGFKKIASASQTSRQQREGRIARVSDGIHHAHGVAPDTELESPFFLPLDAALQALAASLCLRDLRCPLIGVAGL